MKTPRTEDTAQDGASAVRYPYQPLSPEGIQRVHETSMQVLEEVGFAVREPEALELFKKAGADYDPDTGIVKVGERLLREIISTTPPQVTLYGRSEEHDLKLGTDQVYLGTGGTALNILEHETGKRRLARLQDLVDVIRIVDALANVHFMLLPTYPNELQVENVDVNRFFAGLTYTHKHVMGGVYTKEGIRDVISMAEAVAGSPERLRERPFISMITCGISPLILDEKYGSFMLQVARAGLPVAVPTEPLCGATSPVTIAGTLVIQNCDSLINVMATQLANPGTPVIYGCVSTATDLRDLKYLGGPVESGLINASVAQMAQYYHIPYYATAGISDSKTLDAQCGYESAVNNLLVAMAGADFIHDAAGLMEFALTVSKEKLVIDNEILGIALRALRGVTVDEGTLAFDAIKKAGPAGNFVASRHTRRYMRKEHLAPTLSDRETRDLWESGGAKTAAQRAHERVTEILGAQPTRYLDDGLARTLRERFPAVVVP